MEFRILGPLEAYDGDHRLALGGARQRALLALLLLHANEVVSSDRLAEELWGDAGGAEGSKALQVAVSRLRRALEPARAAGEESRVLLTRPPGYELRVATGQLDLQRFEELAEGARAALAAANPAAASEGLREALGLWRGAPLADLGYEAFAQTAIARLEELRAAALEDRIAADLELGRHAELVAELQALAGRHPLRERPRALLMLALYRSGRQAEALEAYQEARRALVEELGIEPGRELEELQGAILRHDTSLHRPAGVERPALEVDGSGPPAIEPRGAFVGRGPELEALLAGLDDACAGRGRLFLLAGEPGIGKSRLAEEVIAHASDRGVRVLVGRCWEAGGAPAYWPWVQSLRAYVRAADTATLRSQLGAGAPELAQIVPELRRHVPDVPEASSPESESARFRLFDATAQFLRNACDSRPIVLFLDDLHAADGPSLLLLRFLAREIGSARILLLAAYRDVDPVPGSPLTATVAEVTREPATRRLALGGLSEREVAEYVERAASQTATPELSEALHQETEGNPLFVTEMVRLLRVEGLASQSPAELRLGIPQSVTEVIARRLAHLSERCNRILVLAAVIGREFDVAALARVGEIAEDELLDLLDEAMAARVVAEVPAGAMRLRFAHVLIRDTLYEGLTSARRVRLHRLVVETLETVYGEKPGPHLTELAHHSVAGSDFDRALRYTWRAGDRAQALLAYEEAARLFRAALDALDRTETRDERTRCELLLSLGEAQARAGDTPAARQAFGAAAAVARRLGLPRELAHAAVGYGGRIVWGRAGDDARLVPLLEEGLAALPEEEVELRSRLLARLAGALRDEPARDRRDRLSREAVDLARRSGNAAALAYALDGRAGSIIGPDTLDECLDLGSQLCEVAERIGDQERMVQGYTHRSIARLQAGDIHRAQDDLEAASRIAHGLRQPAPVWQTAGAHAMLALAEGRVADAEELIPQVFELGELAQRGAALPVYRLQQYALCDFRGGLEEIEPAIRDVVAGFPARPVFRCALAHLHARLGRLAEARRVLDDLARDNFSALPLDQEWPFGMSLLAETAVLLDDADHAAVLYELMVPWATLNVVDQAEGIRGSASRYLGLLATTTERWEEAERHFEAALDDERGDGVSALAGPYPERLQPECCAPGAVPAIASARGSSSRRRSRTTASSG